MRLSLFSIAVAFACLASWIPTAPAREPFVEVSLVFKYTGYREGQTNEQVRAKERTVSASCVGGANCWRIQSDACPNGENLFFYDGTNVYERLRVMKPLPDETLEKMKKAGGPMPAPFDPTRSHATIDIWPSTSGHPMADWTINLTWLALCSGDYLKRKGRLIPLPCELLRHTPDRYAYADKTLTFDDRTRLPRSMDLYLSTNLYVSSIDEFYNGWVGGGGERYRKCMRESVTNLHDGALMFHYAVTATTNFLGKTFPLRFEFFQNGRKFIQNGDWCARGTGEVKLIRKTGAPETLFDRHLHLTIVDWRFKDGASGADANIYQWTKSAVPEMKDRVLQEAFAKRIKQAQRHKEGKDPLPKCAPINLPQPSKMREER